MKTITIRKKGSKPLNDVAMATTYGERVRGLSGLDRPQSLLMVFPCTGRHGIWMWRMGFPLDLVFIDSKKQVVDIKRNVKPISFHPGTWKVFKPRKPARYVLEMPAGEADDIRIGDKLKFNVAEAE